MPTSSTGHGMPEMLTIEIIYALPTKQQLLTLRLPQGSTVTTPRSQAHYFVTEWGKVVLAGCSTWERAERLISIAHPDFRDDLIRQAEAMKIWRRTNKI